MLQFLSNGACICMIPLESKSLVVADDEDSDFSPEKFVFVVLSSTGKFCLIQHDAERHTHIVDFIPSHYMSLVRRCLLFQAYFSPTIRVSERIFSKSALPKTHHSRLRSSLWLINRSIDQLDENSWFVIACDTHGHTLCLDPSHQLLRLRWSIVQTAKNNLNVHLLPFEAVSSIYCSRPGPILTILQQLCSTQNKSIEIPFQQQTGEENVANCEEMLQLEQLAPLLSILPSLQSETKNDHLRSSVTAELCNSLFILYTTNNQRTCYLSYLRELAFKICETENDEERVPIAVLWPENNTQHAQHFVINIFSQTIGFHLSPNKRKVSFHKDLFFSAVLHRLTHADNLVTQANMEKVGLDQLCDIFIKSDNFALLQRLFSYSTPVSGHSDLQLTQSTSAPKQLKSEVLEGRNDVRYTLFYHDNNGERKLVRLRGCFRRDHLILDLNLLDLSDNTQPQWRCNAILPSGEQISFSREEYQDAVIIAQHSLYPSHSSIPLAQVQELLTCLRLLQHTVDSHCTTDEQRQAVMEAALKHEEYLVRLCRAKMNEIQRQQVIARVRSGQPLIKAVPQQQAPAVPAAPTVAVSVKGNKEHYLHVLKIVRGALDRGAQIKADNNRFLARLQAVTAADDDDEGSAYS